MTSQLPWRTRLLAATFTGVCLVTAYSLIDPAAGRHQVASFLFPDTVLLDSWQLVKTEQLTDQRTDLSRRFDAVKSGKHYSYLKNGIPLEIEIRYVVGTRGNVSSLIGKQTAIPLKVFQSGDWHHVKGIGFYTLFLHKDRAYLSTCINSRGGSTITSEQFLHNRYIHDLKYSFLVSWLLGEESPRDLRCLWTHLYTPVNESEPEVAYRILKTAWLDLYHWWQPRFPSL